MNGSYGRMNGTEDFHPPVFTGSGALPGTPDRYRYMEAVGSRNPGRTGRHFIPAISGNGRFRGPRKDTTARTAAGYNLQLRLSQPHINRNKIINNRHKNSRHPQLFLSQSFRILFKTSNRQELFSTCGCTLSTRQAVFGRRFSIGPNPTDTPDGPNRTFRNHIFSIN